MIRPRLLLGGALALSAACSSDVLGQLGWKSTAWNRATWKTQISTACGAPL